MCTLPLLALLLLLVHTITPFAGQLGGTHTFAQKLTHLRTAEHSSNQGRAGQGRAGDTYVCVHVCYAWAELGAALQAVAAAGMHATHIPEGGEQEV